MKGGENSGNRQTDGGDKELRTAKTLSSGTGNVSALESMGKETWVRV